MNTKAQAKTQAKTSTAPAAARIPQPPLAEPEHKAARPDIAAQLEGAARLGHSLGAVGVDSSPPPLIQRQEMPEEEEEELQLKREPAALQRQELPEEEEEELMLKPEEGRVGPQGGPVPPEVESAINRARGGGQPLESALQEQMSEMMGHDFSRVRVHTGPAADDVNQALSARAFTTGQDIFFRQGEYNPGSMRGRELVAHELSHVIQQGTRRVPGITSGMSVRPASEAFEHEAQAAANTANWAPPPEGGKVLPSRALRDAAFAVQRALSNDIEPEQLVKNHANVLKMVGGKVRLRFNNQDLLCTQAVALAKRGDTQLNDVGELLTLQNEVQTAGLGAPQDAEINPGPRGGYRTPNKVAHWLEGEVPNRAHKHAAVLRESGAAAGFNQGIWVRGGKGPGEYNVGKILWPHDDTKVRLTD